MKKTLIVLSFLFIAHALSVAPPMYTVFAGGLPAGTSYESNTFYTPVGPDAHSVAGAQDETKTVAQTETSTTTYKNTYVTGTVQQLNGNIVTLQTEEGVREFILPQNEFITRGNISTPMSSLQPGEEISLYFNHQGAIESVELGQPKGIFSQISIPQQVQNIIPLVVLSFVMAGIITTLIARRREEVPTYSKPQIIGI